MEGQKPNSRDICQRKEDTIWFSTSDHRHTKTSHRKALTSGSRDFIGYTHCALHPIESLSWLLCKAAPNPGRHSYPWTVFFK